MKIVYSYCVLDIIHDGHLLMLKNAKKIAGPEGRLVVGILTDEAVMEKKPKPVLSFHERMSLAKAIKYVDLVVPQETYSPLPNVRTIKPDVLVESVSHTDESIKEVEKCMQELGGQVIVLPYYPDSSSSMIKEKIKEH